MPNCAVYVRHEGRILTSKEATFLLAAPRIAELMEYFEHSLKLTRTSVQNINWNAFSRVRSRYPALNKFGTKLATGWLPTNAYLHVTENGTLLAER